MTYDQEKIIRKLNRYLARQQRELILNQGYCHGLTLLWLYEMSIGNEIWFYETIQKIIQVPIRNDPDIEKFLSYMEWLQRPEKYVPSIRQMDINKTMEIPIALRFSGVFNPDEFENILKAVLQEKSMIVFSGPGHTIGVFRRKNIFYFFNANDRQKKAKQMTSLFALKNSILKGLFTNFGFSTEKFSLMMHVIEEKRCDTKWNVMLHRFNENLRNMHKRTCDLGLNPLYLATESHDTSRVDYLLENNAAVNNATLDGRFPLLIASYSGYEDIVTKLLEFGAEPDLEGREGIPLYVASLYGHMKVVQTLLDFNADVNLADRDGETALFAAVESQHADIVELLLKNGADAKHVRKNEETPFDIAITHKNPAIIQLLKERKYSPRFFKQIDDATLEHHAMFLKKK